MTAPQPEEPQVQDDDDGAAENAAPPPEVVEPDPLIEAEARAAEYFALAQRKQAEFENFRKRAAGQAAQAEDRGVAKLAKELFAPLDHLELALKAAEQAEGTEEWLTGIRSVQEEFKSALARAGIEAFAPAGEVFDPNLHEAIAHAPIEGAQSGTVAEVYQAGYRLSSGAVLRAARVVVAQ